MHNMLATHDKDHCLDIIRRIRDTFYDDRINIVYAMKIERNPSVLGTYYSMNDAVWLTLEAFYMDPLKLYLAADELDIEYEFGISFLELVELLVPHLAGIALGDPGVISQENKRKRLAEAALDEYRHKQARRDLRIAS
jgi:hypothetical protein